jgi:hypothetical protein
MTSRAQQSPDTTRTYLWCDHCKRSYRHEDAPEGRCPICGGPTSATGKMNALLRGLMANELVASDIPTKHRQLIRLVWSRHGQGQQYYKVLAPNMPYTRFEARVVDLICRGAREGWVTVVIPPAPSDDEAQYKIVFNDEDRFIDELERLASTPNR